MTLHQSQGLPLPPSNTVEQCIVELMNANPGCNMNGQLTVQKVTGNIHFAPGRSFMQSHESHVHHVHEFNPRTVYKFNSSHIIHKYVQ